MWGPSFGAGVTARYRGVTSTGAAVNVLSHQGQRCSPAHVDALRSILGSVGLLSYASSDDAASSSELSEQHGFAERCNEFPPIGLIDSILLLLNPQSYVAEV